MMILSAALGLALAAATTPPAGSSAPQADDPPPAVTRFKCEDGQDLTAQFVSRNAGLVAIVNSGAGPHALPLVPWDGGEIRLTWSDGLRTLTWSPGVQIMFMEGRTHRMCGRGGGHGGHSAPKGSGPARAT